MIFVFLKKMEKFELHVCQKKIEKSQLTPFFGWYGMVLAMWQLLTMLLWLRH